MKLATLLSALAAGFAAFTLLPASANHNGEAQAATTGHRIAFGVFTPGAPETTSAMANFIDRVGQRPVIWHTYRNWPDDPFPTVLMKNPADNGAVPMISWQPGGYNLRDIANGRYDSYIRESADRAVAWGGPILLRFAHEMNGDWYSWGLGVDGNTAADYKAAWRHAVRVFRAEHADNVRWVWAPNTGSFNSLFPGDKWIDYIGLDGYNWGEKYNVWLSFEQVFDDSYRAITRLSRKPLLITEFGANAKGGDKAAWIKHAFSSSVANRYPRIRALIWFDKDQDGSDWRIDSSGDTLSAFRGVIKASRFNLSAADLLAGSGADPSPPADSPTPAPQPTRTPVSNPAPPSTPTAAGRGMRCGVHPRRSLRMSNMWTIMVPIRCNRAASQGCFGVVTVKHRGSGRTLGVAEVELRRGRTRPVRIGLPGWANSSLVNRYRLAARVTLRTHDECRVSPARRVTLKR